MTEQHDIPPAGRLWIWAIDVPVDPDIPDVYRLHDRAAALSPTPLELARLLGLQVEQDAPAFWRILITSPADPGGPEALIYTSAEYRAWSATPEGASEIARLDLLIEGFPPAEGLSAFDVLRPPPEGDQLLSGIAVADPDAPPHAVHWHPRLAHSLRHFEGLMGDDGTPDSVKILAETGDMLMEALRVALKHAMDRHPDEPWAACDNSAVLVAKVAATYVSAYLASQREA